MRYAANRNNTKLVNPISADIASIDRGKAGLYSVRGSSTWKTIDVMKSWRYHSSRYSPRFTPKKRKLFPLSKGNGIECLENYHRSSKQPTSVLANPLPAQSFSIQSAITRIHLFISLSLSLILSSKFSKFPRPWKFECFAAFEVTSNGSEDERARSRNFFACCAMVEVVFREILSRVSSIPLWFEIRLWKFRSKSMGIDRSFIIPDRWIVCISENRKYDYRSDVF